MNNEKANFYMMPGDPSKKLDTPGGFSYKATSTMNKLGFGPLNDGHKDEEAGMNYGHTALNDGHEGGTAMNDGHDDTALPKLEDLDGSGDVTKKDYLIGAGVIDKQGNKIKK